ncbi:MAG: polymer-forming cytoskeletal protein [Methanomicrobiales archaeon]|nr:polymer-forming cytoskeletal protein [Methanomicrobiales archaeon]
MKVYQRGDTFIAPKGSFFDGNVRIEGNFIVPAETHFWGRLEVAGRLELGPYSTIGGGVTCSSAVIGKGVKIKGALEVLEDVTVCDDARIRSIHAGGNITLRPGIVVGTVQSDETIFVYGKIKSGTLTGRNVKVVGNH